VEELELLKQHDGKAPLRETPGNGCSHDARANYRYVRAPVQVNRHAEV